MDESRLLARLDRLESIDEIRQLAARYSLSLDMRDLDAHVNLFAADIRVSREKVGRAHLKAWLDETLRDQFTGTSHHLGIDVHDCAQARNENYRQGTLRPSMVFTVEPMLNAGKPDVKTLSDGWTTVTRDRSLSAQFEHQIGITEDGCEIFTLSPAGYTKPPYGV